ncbi:hypothetical protein MAM1_0075d04309 [Mucor ambiguus]|uniref:Uncharacterized protein n=1 Tax=Mucor ambiguus TaxID=91626 RepID=A0A0C9MC11_9FUNG|nr:hypothetical protein MAM1_0075d04309 [Mucor ambiguus]
MSSGYVDPPVPKDKRSYSPSPTSFDEICVRDDFRQTKKDLLEVLVDLDKTEHSLSSLMGQLKNSKNPLRGAQLASQRFQLMMRIKELKKTYHKLKNRVYLIDREMKSLSRLNQQDPEDGEISSVQAKLEGTYDDSGLQQQKKRRL